MDSSAQTFTVPDLNPTYGALLIGLLFATFFQGVLTLQTYIYYERFPTDSKWLKSLVAIVWVFDVAHLVLIGQATYYYVITNWGNQNILPDATVELNLHLAMVALASIACQGFFLRRIWLFSKGNYIIVGALSAACLTVFALHVSMSIQINRVLLVAQYSSYTSELISTFSIGAAADITMALLMVYYLTGERSDFRRTSTVVGALIQYTIATGLASSLLAIACIVAYFIRPKTFIFIAMHFSLGRMYTNALLANLNSRQALREKISTATPWSKKSLNWANFSVSRSKRNDTPSATMGSHSGTSEVQVRTEIQLESGSLPYDLRKYGTNSLINEGDSIEMNKRGDV